LSPDWMLLVAVQYWMFCAEPWCGCDGLCVAAVLEPWRCECLFHVGCAQVCLRQCAGLLDVLPLVIAARWHGGILGARCGA
jgi:hypothetical protein